MIFDSPKSPSFKKDRRGWNKAWEHDLALLYGSSVDFAQTRGQPLPSLFQLARARGTIPEDHITDKSAMHLQEIKRYICALQRKLTCKAAKSFAEDDFEAKWVACSALEREELILEGLVRTCEIAPEYEDQRRWAPELVLDRLNHASGRGYIDLLKTLLLQNPDNLVEFNSVPNLVYDQITAIGDNPSLGVVVYKKQLDTDRIHILTKVVWNILLAFYGESEEIVHVKSQQRGRDDKRHLKKILEHPGLDAETQAMIKARVQESSKLWQRSERCCASCGLTADRAGVSSLSACQRCKAIGRVVFYCSKKCQVENWKNGSPPHKTICGDKNAMIDAVLAPSARKSVPAGKENSEFGHPRRGYIRSPALLHQLDNLKKEPETDYVFIQPAPLCDFTIKITKPNVRELFRACLKRAACEHAPREVYQMFLLLKSAAISSPEYGIEGLKKQFFKEYGYDIDVLKAEYDP
ncbi:hypothetical protein GGX14DRAFT_478131 [Mycena pura]|uniref:MYND-type domain-containing protein n=1 Tax=Mycena pura TaxID=153505 RepID=A0AAD6Y2F2_9AGAR|nr:hypothetical protein GGX14DRAFT_478131 [Mycena pura]